MFHRKSHSEKVIATRKLRMWCDFMDSMFQSPLMLLKSGSMPSIGEGFSEEIAPTFKSTKDQCECERASQAV